MKIYIDNCCYNRPFDGYTDNRSVAEVSAIEAIVNVGKIAGYIFIGSPTITKELDKTQKSKPEKWMKILDFYNSIVNEYVELTPKIETRAHAFMAVWPKESDCFHLAFAEAAGADFLLTTDDRFENANARLNMSIVNVINPTNLLREIEEWER